MKLTSIETLTDGQKEEVAEKRAAAVKFMEGVQADRAAKQPHDDPLYNLDGIIRTLETLKKDTDAIFNRPPPKVEEPPAADANMKEDEKPAGEKPAEGEKQPEGSGEAPAEEKKEGDAEMKNEEAKAE